MKRLKKIFLIQQSIIIGGLLFFFMVNWVIDPFNYNQLFDIDFRKEKISYIMNYRLFKLIKFNNNPQKKIIFGDSRGDKLKEKYLIKKGLSFSNMSYGGGGAV
ncbi:MAG: hypothetical protein PHQ11_08840 [Paludibacter sp.]|nr:hypothetical protein [Paludibacter sp.]